MSCLTELLKNQNKDKNAIAAVRAVGPQKALDPFVVAQDEGARRDIIAE